VDHQWNEEWSRDSRGKARPVDKISERNSNTSRGRGCGMKGSEALDADRADSCNKLKERDGPSSLLGREQLFISTAGSIVTTKNH
jgi:hypothetical protein